eukprot:14999450-Alexandrium_andersonii.AAC.1
MVVARLGPTDGAWDDVSKFVVPVSKVASGTAQKRWIAPPDHARVSGGHRFPEQATSIWEKVAWWPEAHGD